MERLDLDRRRDASGIIGTAFQTWWSHLGLFAALAALVVFPIAVLVDGLWIGQLSDVDATGSVRAQVISAVVWTLVATPLVTAMYVLVVLELSRGNRPPVGKAIADGVKVLPAVAIAVLLYSVAAGLGLIFLIVPGIWLGVLFVFAAQAAVVDGARGFAALRRSSQVVRGSWWRTFGITILLSIIAALLAVPLGFLTLLVGSLAENGPLYVLGSAIAQTVILSFTALATTLLFFDLRSRQGEGVPHQALVHPERPATEPA